MSRGLAIGRSIADAIEASTPKPQSKPTARYYTFVNGKAVAADVISISVERNWVDVTAFGDHGNTYTQLASSTVYLRMYWNDQFDWQVQTMDMDYVLGHTRYKGTLHVRDCSINAAIDDVMTVEITGTSDDLSVTPV